MKNPIYIHDAALISPAGVQGFTSDVPFFTSLGGTSIGQVNVSIENQLAAVRAENNQYNKLDRSTLLAILAARQLQLDTSDIAVNIGSSRGATGLWEAFHHQFVTTGSVPVPASPLTTLGNISSWVAQDLGVDQVAFSHSITCATAAHSILNAIAWLESGMATTFIAGGAEAPLTDFTIAQMKALRIYSQEQGIFKCRALDPNKTANTMILGEAAACFVLSKNKGTSAVKIVGYGTAIESLQSATSMSVEGIGFQKSMRQAIGDNSLDAVDAIITHAPGTILGDQSEMEAIKSVFNDDASYKGKYPRLFNNKWQIGHSLGASAAVNLYMALQLLTDDIQPVLPYLNHEIYNPRGHDRKPKLILINASGFGGNCVSLLVEKEE